MLEKCVEENKLDDICAVLKTIHKAEDTTKAFAKIGSTLNPKIISQLDHLLIPSPDGTMEEITDSNAIFQNLLQRGLHDLTQSEGTPLTNPLFPRIAEHTQMDC